MITQRTEYLIEVPKTPEDLSQLTFINQIKEFHSNLEKGDLGFEDIIDNGFILYGETRIGKTATALYLAGDTLKATKKNGEHMVQSTLSHYKKIKIGNTTKSQTINPNYLQLKGVKELNFQGSTYIVDTPGYGDSFGVLRVLANGYYHYRLYRMVKKIKFIICFDAIHLNNTAKQFFSTIHQWTESFKDYLKVCQQIWQSCVFLFTKVEKESPEQSIIQRINAIIQDMKPGQSEHAEIIQEKLKKFITFMVQEKRIFCIKKLKNNQKASGRDLLIQINNKITKWWQRDYDPETNTVNMEPIQFSITKKIIIQTMKSPRFQKQFIELIHYYNIRFKQFIEMSKLNQNTKYSFTFIIDELVKDAMGSPNSNNFLELMLGYVKKFYNCYDQTFSQERQRKQKQLFELGKQSTVSTVPAAKIVALIEKNYLVNKFKTLQKIQTLKSQINCLQFDQRNLNWLQKCQENFIKIIKELNRISFKRSKSVQIIYKYGYLIYRIIEEAKVFLLLMVLSVSKQTQAKLHQQTNGKFIDIMRYLQSMMGIDYRCNGIQCKYKDLHLKFVKNFNLSDKVYQNLIINEALVNFFSQIDIVSQEDSEKLVQIILKYAEQTLKLNSEKTSIKMEQIGKLIKRLTDSRSNCAIAYYQQQNFQEKNLFLIRKTSDFIGKLLELIEEYSLARKVYQSVKFVDDVCRLYQIQIEGLSQIESKNQANRKMSFDLRIQYSGYLSSHLRQNQAIVNLQKTFKLAINNNELAIIREVMLVLMADLRNNTLTRYERQIQVETYFETFDNQLENRLFSFYKPSE